MNMDKKLLKAKHELQKYTVIWALIGICSGLILTANGLGYLTKSYTDSNEWILYRVIYSNWNACFI